MKYLLDVNALIAWQPPAAEDHEVFHARAARETFRAFATCAQVELRFLRVSMQAFGYSAAAAQAALAEIKRSTGGIIREAPSPVSPAWCRRPGQTSDAYLAQVASAAGLSLATFDAGIPGATLIR